MRIRRVRASVRGKHKRQRRRGCRGRKPGNIWWAGDEVSDIPQSLSKLSRQTGLTYFGWLSTEYGTRSLKWTRPRVKNKHTRSPMHTWVNMSGNLFTNFARFQRCTGIAVLVS